MTRYVYFHGLPGSPSELSFLKERGATPPPVLHPADWQRLEKEITKEITHADTGVIGFSMGAFAALRAAAATKNPLASLHLISPAAPLQLGDFLKDMAGAPVFKAAQKSKLRLQTLTSIQRGLNLIAPRLLLQQVFSDSPPADQALLTDESFRESCSTGFQSAFVTDRPRYIATIKDYVQPWGQLLDHIECPVFLYQGAADTWTPPAMARALAQRLGDQCTITMLEDLGHYSTLRAVLPKILSE